MAKTWSVGLFACLLVWFAPLFEIKILIILAFLSFAIMSGGALYLRYIKEKRLIPFIMSAPEAEDKNVDCYVKLIGNLDQRVKYTTPYSKKVCIFYVAKLYGIWNEKLKKPKKGHKKSKKIIDITCSQANLLICTTTHTVHLPTQDFFRAAQLLVPSISKTLEPATVDLPLSNRQHRYLSFQATEFFGSSQRRVVALGKLTKKNGQLFLEPTHLNSHPTIFHFGDAESLHVQLQERFQQKYKSLAFESVLSLLISSLLLLAIMNLSSP